MKQICISRSAIHENSESFGKYKKTLNEKDLSLEQVKDFPSDMIAPPIAIIEKDDDVCVDDRGSQHTNEVLVNNVVIKDEHGNVLLTLYHVPEKQITMGSYKANIWIETDQEIEVSDKLFHYDKDTNRIVER